MTFKAIATKEKQEQILNNQANINNKINNINFDITSGLYSSANHITLSSPNIVTLVEFSGNNEIHGIVVNAATSNCSVAIELWVDGSLRFTAWIAANGENNTLSIPIKFKTLSLFSIKARRSSGSNPFASVSYALGRR